MSKALASAESYGFAPSQIELIKNTVAKGATTDEFKLFLYRCQNLGLDPLKPGLVHFIKYGNSPGTIVVGIEGFRARAGRTGKLSGIKRGVIRDETGNCIGAWCEVKRSDWQDVAREEVSRAEYDTKKAMWLKMPETMIKKVAEAAALRMAFPEELGGVYATEEMEQARRGNPDARMALTEARDTYDPTDLATGKRETVEKSALAIPGDYVFKFGSLKGVKIKDCSREDLEGWTEQMMNEAQRQGKEITPGGPVADAFTNIEAYLAELEPS